jgi:hypothetical protein
MLLCSFTLQLSRELHTSMPDDLQEVKARLSAARRCTASCDASPRTPAVDGSTSPQPWVLAFVFTWAWTIVAEHGPRHRPGRERLRARPAVRPPDSQDSPPPCNRHHTSLNTTARRPSGGRMAKGDGSTKRLKGAAIGLLLALC